MERSTNGKPFLLDQMNIKSAKGLPWCADSSSFLIFVIRPFCYFLFCVFLFLRGRAKVQNGSNNFFSIS